MDVLIGALAVIDGAIIVTRNIKHFKRIPNLEILSY
jgi:predicted nucleic acid-binding protein